MMKARPAARHPWSRTIVPSANRNAVRSATRVSRVRFASVKPESFIEYSNRPMILYRLDEGTHVPSRPKRPVDKGSFARGARRRGRNDRYGARLVAQSWHSRERGADVLKSDHCGS